MYPPAPSPSRFWKRRHTFLGLLLLALVAPAGWVTAGESSEPYIVLLKGGGTAGANPAQGATTATGTSSFRQLAERKPLTDKRSADRATINHQVSAIAGRSGVQVGSVYSSAMGGFSARMTSSQVRSVSADSAVAAVIPDVEIEVEDGLAGDAAGGLRTTGNPDSQVQPGIQRIGARSSRVTSFTGRNQKIDADVAIIDTGIERNHPDLNVAGGYNCTSRKRDQWDDVNGHGTHVAGIVGALDNRIGVVGVAPGVRLWSVRVLDQRGKGFLSWMVCGIDWVTAQRESGSSDRPFFEVANMSISFGLPGNNDGACGAAAGDPLHAAICRSVERGTVYVVAAGNESRNAKRSRPAAYDEVITVSAMADYDGRGGGRGNSSASCPYWSPEADDAFASFSNYGPDVDLIAPGKCVLSTYIGKKYAWMSGTSMATPHVTGAAAIYRSMFPRAMPSQVRQGLQAVGTLDWNTKTDPDTEHEKAVYIGAFRTMADFTVRAESPTAPIEPGAKVALAVSISRVGGFEDPVTLSLRNPPTGISAAAVVARRGAATFEVETSGRIKSGRYTLTILARGQDVDHTTAVEIVVGATLPRAAFVSPPDGLTVQSAANVRVTWAEQSGGTSITARRLERQVGRIRTPGTCDGVRFSTDLTRPRPGAITDRTRPGYCYRWRLLIGDRAGKRTVVYSGSVLVDATAPAAPSVSLGGTRISIDLDGLGVEEAYVGSGGTLWVRGGVSGSVELEVAARDNEAGIAANSAALRAGSGWRLRWIGDSAAGELRLDYSTRGADGDLLVSSTNGAGAQGGATMGRLARDFGRPDAVEWVSAPSGSRAAVASDDFRLTWTGGSDDGSGLAQQHIIRRWRAALDRNGNFKRNGFSADGPYRLAANGTLESNLTPGYCYVWSVRTMDNVGNFTDSAISGYVLVTPNR